MDLLNLHTFAKEQTKFENGSVVVLGTFDGVHIGHQSVIARARSLALQNELPLVVYTFHSLTKESPQIETEDEKIEKIAQLGADYIALEDFFAVKDFDKETFAVSVLKDRFHAKIAVCGFNYRFGKGGAWNGRDLDAELQKYGAECVICDEIAVDGATISSSAIRKKIESGDVESVLPLCGAYQIKEIVRHGKELGKKLGFPTINQTIPKNKVVPKRGVYVTEAELGEDVYPAVTNVGVRPTTDRDGTLNMETHIIGFSGNLYGCGVKVRFYRFLRDEIAFDTVERLQEQLKKDKESALSYFQ